MELLWKIVESGLSKLIDKGIDYALSKQERTTFEALQSNMKLLCAKAIDIKVDIRKAELSDKKKRKREINEWLEQVQTIENELHILEHEIRNEGLIRKFFSGDQATTLEARVRGLVEQSRHFGELVCDVCDIKGDILLTKGLVGEEFDKNLETILRFLLVDNVSSIGIYGMGGIGKTTLAKHVNNRLQQQTHERVAWITVSQKFTISKLQDEIAKFVHLDLSHEHNEDKRASKLNRVLSKSKNLVFIFDDVWEDIDLKMLGDPLSLDGCKLLITTRSKKVCNQIRCERLIKVKTLKENEAWNLFEETHGQVMNLSTEVQEIAKFMVELCDGLPLGVITIAGSMKGETDYHVWGDALAELKESTMGQEDMEEKVFKVLKYSFDRLDQRHERKNRYSKFQLCFLYCSLYPEDYKISRKELIRKLILEEYLDKRKSRKELISQGHAILDRLVNVCLLERTEKGGVKMHDLVRAMALKINEGKTKLIVGHPTLNEISIEEEWTQDVEKICLMSNRTERIEDRVSPNCPKLSTLLLLGVTHPNLVIPDSFFHQMLYLFILDLSWTLFNKLPNSLSHLVSLKALLLTRCSDLEHVPYLGNMKELRELDLSYTKIKEIPQGMEELSNLKFISLLGARYLKMLPKHLLLKFPYLQCLYLPPDKQVPIGEIQELEHLEEFGGQVTCASDFNQLIRSRSSLNYHIALAGDRHYGYSEGDYNNNELGLFKYNFNLKKNKDVVLLVENIKRLTLQNCKGLSMCLVEDLPRLNNPMSIQRLTIIDCQEIECLLRTEQLSERDALTSSSVSILPPPTHGLFSSLRELRIDGCENIKKLGLLASQLQNLKKLEIRNCKMIEGLLEASEKNGGVESREMHVVSLPKLEELYLVRLPKLKSICNVTLVCSSIQYISLKACQGLEKLPLVFDQSNYETPPSSLKNICLGRGERKWWEKLELGHTSHHSLLQRFVGF